MTRNTKGQFAQNKAKDTFAMLATAFIMISIAYYAHNAHANEPELTIPKRVMSHEIKWINATEHTEVCIKNELETYCAMDEALLIESIKQTDKPAVKTVTKQAVEAPKVNSKSGYTRKAHNQEIANIVIAEANKQGYADIELALDIVDCESRFDPKARNNKGNTPSYSTDLGLWQYNDYWQRNNLTQECMLDVECSTKQAIKDLKNGKAHQWACLKVVR